MPKYVDQQVVTRERLGDFEFMPQHGASEHVELGACYGRFTVDPLSEKQ